MTIGVGAARPNPLMPSPEELERMFIVEGRTAREIAAMYGLTRNAVAGRLDRLGLKKVILGVPRWRTPVKPRRLAVEDGLPPTSAGRAAPAGGCRWIEGDPAGERTLWCGHEAAAGRSYCEAHERRAYVGREDGVA